MTAATSALAILPFRMFGGYKPRQTSNNAL